MKFLKLVLTITISSFILASCDTASTAIKKIDSDQNINNASLSTEDQKINEDKIIEAEEAQIDLDYPVDWEPKITSTPAKQPHKSLYLPKSNIQKIKTYFYDDIDIDNVKEKKLDEDEYFFSGHVIYIDNSSIIYYFDKDNNEYSSERLNLNIRQKPIKDFNDFHKDTIYKMLEVGGAENPKKFFEELVDSSEITKYEGCTVQQKQVKYGMVDITSCIDDDKTVLTIYNPDFE